MTADIQGRVGEILRIVLDLPDDRDVSLIRKITTPTWDSLAHASIIAAMESEFEIEFDPVDYELISSYESACLLVEEKVH